MIFTNLLHLPLLPFFPALLRAIDKHPDDTDQVDSAKYRPCNCRSCACSLRIHTPGSVLNVEIRHFMSIIHCCFILCKPYDIPRHLHFRNTTRVSHDPHVGLAWVLLVARSVGCLKREIKTQEESTMESGTLETYRQQLLAMQQQLTQRIFHAEETMQAMAADRDIERTDRVQEEAAEVALAALDEQGRREIAEISVALARIDEGTYGVCEVCGEAIGTARLTAMPIARRCVPCQERLEHRRQ